MRGYKVEVHGAALHRRTEVLALPRVLRRTEAAEVVAGVGVFLSRVEVVHGWLLVYVTLTLNWIQEIQGPSLRRVDAETSSA